MSNIPSPFGSALGSPVGRGASIVPGASETGFKIPPSDTTAVDKGDPSSRTAAPEAQAAGALVPGQAVKGGSPANKPLTLAEAYEDAVKNGKTDGYPSLYNSYFG